MAEFRMPKLGADMTAGTLIAWKVRPGATVRRGDVIAEVETDKGVIDVEIFADGVLEKLLVQPGARVPVGTALAIVGGADEPAPAAAPAPPAPAAVVVPTPGAGALPPPGDMSRLPISPSARALARELAVDARTVQGTGRGGAITRDDIQRAAAAQKHAPASGDRLGRLRQTIAAAMSRSKREIPHYYLSTTIDMAPAMTWLAEENARRPVAERLLYGVLLLKAVAVALHEVPELNATWSGDRVVPGQRINVGVAISLRQGGLVAPAIHDTDKLRIDELMARFRDLVQRARAWSLRSSELSDPTITVTSLGDQGVEAAFGVIYPPQVAIVGFGRIVDRPWVVGGQVVPRQVITATLSADHRVSDGHRGGLFLAAVNRLLQEPSKL